MATPPSRPKSVFHSEMQGVSFLTAGLKGTPEEQQRELGKRMATFRSMRNMTQGQLAEMLKKSRTTVNQYEKGNIAPPLSVIDEIAGALEVDPVALAYGRAVQPPDAGETYRAIDKAREELFLTTSLSISQRLGINSKGGGLLEMSSDAPHFGLRQGDLLIVDISRTEVRGDGRLYAVVNDADEISLIKTDVQLEANATSIGITLGHGQASKVRADLLNVRGLVKASLRYE